MRTDTLRWLGRQVAAKLTLTVYRASQVIWLLPRRLLRTAMHFGSGVRSLGGGRHSAEGAFFWWIEAALYVLDLSGVVELYETVADWVKFNTRGLTDRELKLARSVFGERVNYRRVRLDERAWLGPRQGRYCYVSFFTINSWGPMTDAILIHELVHVWQYQRVGIAYIPRALRALVSEEGYDYGGAEALSRGRLTGKRLLDFNYEQQADIITDYYRLRNGQRPVWSRNSRPDLNDYAHYAEQLQSAS